MRINRRYAILMGMVFRQDTGSDEQIGVHFHTHNNIWSLFNRRFVDGVRQMAGLMCCYRLNKLKMTISGVVILLLLERYRYFKLTMSC